MTAAPDAVGATLGLAEAAAVLWDVVIIGAGPAGSAAALGLARLGRRVLLVDRYAFPRPKVCGGCLNRQALAGLDALGLGGLLGRLGAVPLVAYEVAAGPGRTARLALPAGAAVSRARLDAALAWEAVAAGAEFLPQTHARLGPARAEARTVHLGRPEAAGEVRARVVLAASGLGRSLGPDAPAVRVAPGSRMGTSTMIAVAPKTYAEGTIFMACGTEGYAGLVRLEDGRLNVAASIAPGLVRTCGGPGPAVARILAEAGFAVPEGLAEAPWRGTPPLTVSVARPAADRLFLIGDAAGYVEPFTGEGMALALAAGRQVVPLADRACQGWDPGMAGAWTRLYRGTVARRQWVCKGLAKLVRRPWLTRTLVRTLALAPGAAGPVLRYMNGNEEI